MGSMTGAAVGGATVKTSKEENVINALLQCRNLTEVSKVTNTPPRTLYTMMKNPKFKEQLNDVKHNALSQSVLKLNHIAGLATDILAEIATDKKANAQARVMACRTLLETVEKLNTQVDIMARLDELEAAQAENSRD